MQNRHIHRIIYRIRHQYFTLNNVVIVLACLIALGWAWGSLEMMQRNHKLQRELDGKQRELALAELQVENLELEKRYYQTEEYQELAAREQLGKVAKGEHVLIVPEKKANDEQISDNTRTVERQAPSNLQQWLDFLFGGTRSRLQ